MSSPCGAGLRRFLTTFGVASALSSSLGLSLTLGYALLLPRASLPGIHQALVGVFALCQMPALLAALAATRTSPQEAGSAQRSS